MARKQQIIDQQQEDLAASVRQQQRKMARKQQIIDQQQEDLAASQNEIERLRTEVNELKKRKREHSSNIASSQ